MTPLEHLWNGWRATYVTTAGKRPAEEIAAHPLTGKVLSLRVDVAGLVQPAYVG